LAVIGSEIYKAYTEVCYRHVSPVDIFG